MKKALFLSVLLLALVATLHAQAPRSINSQAVLRDAAGRLIANQSVGVRIIIAQGFPTGTVAYEETHIATTNENGLYTITIGAGTPATGTFSAIDWGNGPYFITTDIDPAGGSNYTITTSQQFLSVPYALFADTAVRVAQAHTADNANHADNADASTTSLHADRADYADTALYYQERQVLTLGHDTIYLTGGSYVVLPPSGNANINNRYIDSVIRANNSTVVNRYVDSVVRANNTTVVNNIQSQISDSVRQMQTMLRDSIIIRHSDSSRTAIYSDTARYYQERQVLTLGHDTIYLTGGSYVVLPPSSNANLNNHYIDSVVNARTTTVVNNLQNQLADSSRTLRTVIRDSSLSLMRDSIVSIIRDSATTIQQNISTLPAGTCYASCSSVDSLKRMLDSVVYVYDSLSRRLIWKIDSVSAANSSNSGVGQSTNGIGALPGIFSVGPNSFVKFSQGNLQYQASTDTWRFAEHQYDYVGDATMGNVYIGGTKSDNKYISTTYDGWIDLFGWGTSGYHYSGDYKNKYFLPCDTSISAWAPNQNYFGYGPTPNVIEMYLKDLIRGNAHYDWGVHNAISNGGNAIRQWRTLTINEWKYLLNTRGGTFDAKFCMATVNGVKGMILFPDNYVQPTGIPAPSHINGVVDYLDVFTSGQWDSMESAGCVFLPAAGRRGDAFSGVTIFYSGSYGHYWSSSSCDISSFAYDYTGRAYMLYFWKSEMKTMDNVRYLGMSVRLVQDI